jgi:hypothetical protein
MSTFYLHYLLQSGHHCGSFLAPPPRFAWLLVSCVEALEWSRLNLHVLGDAEVAAFNAALEDKPTMILRG